MGRAFGSRVLVAVCGALVVLLGALAAVQYRWSKRVAAADAQREREHLESAAALFAKEFNDVAGQAAEFLRTDARAALEAGKPLAQIPKLIGELYYLDDGQARRLTPAGTFESAPAPSWIPTTRCPALAAEQPRALVVQIYDLAEIRTSGPDQIRFLSAFSRQRCFAARFNEAYLRSALFPRLIVQSFGESSAREYDFGVVLRDRPGEALYGAPLRADVSRPFFVGAPLSLPRLPSGAGGAGAAGKTAVYVQRVESTIVTKRAEGAVAVFGPGVWELQIGHRGMPLGEAFEQTRRRDLLLSLAVEALLVAAIVFLVVGARRTQRLADQKMRFIAGVSHDLRTPASAIAMLARNQADGLVTGVEKVRQYGELIHQQSRRLNEMVEQTLEYAGIHSGLRRPAREEVDLRRLIEEVVEAHREDLERGGFEVEMMIEADLPPAAGDRRLLRTAVENLLSNAEKHARSGRWIRVSAVHDRKLKEVRISVEDRGAGIEAAEQEVIFEPFSRGRAAVEAQIPGSGLGLSLVRSALEAHRGNVTLVSEAGRGSSFTLHLPL